MHKYENGIAEKPACGEAEGSAAAAQEPAASSGGDAEEVMALGVRDGLLVPESCSQRAGACELEPTSIGETHGRWAWGMVGGTLCGQEGGVLLCFL